MLDLRKGGTVEQKRQRTCDNLNRILGDCSTFSPSMIVDKYKTNYTTASKYVRLLTLLRRVDVNGMKINPESVTFNEVVKLGPLKKAIQKVNRFDVKRGKAMGPKPLLPNPVVLSMTTSDEEVDGEKISMSPEALAKLIKLLR